jgi:hypothetical protein
MRRKTLILAMVLGLTVVAAAGAETPKVGADGGSLVLSSSADSRKGGASGDTLYDLLGQEVQVFIYNNKARVWPRGVGRTLYWPPRNSWTGRHDPRLDALINKYASVYGVDPALVRAVMRNESGFNAAAVSPKGAQGLMQLMPGTASLMGVRDPFDPEQNIAGGVGYLRRCLDRFGHNVPLAVAAYNAGPEAVARYCSIPPYQETQVFVKNVLGSYNAYGANPALNKPPAKVSAAPVLSVNKEVKNPAIKKAEVPEDGKEVRRRPKAKIIEVRSHKAQARAIPILKD